jgi:hypothetical protein
MFETIGVCALAALGLVACAAPPTEDAAAPKPGAAAEHLKRGEYLVRVAACNDCHTPWKLGPNGPEPDIARMLSGHPADMVLPPAPSTGSQAWVMISAATNTAFAGPWGVSYATNLTPDQDTGLGAWTEEIFINTMRTGKHWGQSRPILPPMPWPNYAQMPDDDLKAVFAYLRSIPALRNAVPEPLPPGGEAVAMENPSN